MIKGIAETRVVTINDVLLAPEASQKVMNHSPDGYNWGYSGSGPAQLALALLLEFTKDERRSVQMHQKFKSDVVAKLPQGKDFAMSEMVVQNWLAVNKITT
jgi:hypothetical protein